MLDVRSESVAFRRSKRQGLTMSVTERYMRNDIPCGLHGCRTCTMNAELARKGVSLLDVTLGQILVPDASAVSRFIALFEQEDELKNLVFCQTVIDALDRRNRTRTMRNVRKIAADPARSSVVFANEVFAQTRVHGKSADVDRDTRAVVRAAEWYRQHLEAQNKAQRVVILTQREVYSAEHGVEVWRLEDYLAEQHPKLVEHFRAIEQATQDGDMDVTAMSAGEFAQARLQAKAQGSYAKHYSEGDISDGLRNGTLVRGTIRLRAGGGTRSESQGVIERSDAPDIVVIGRAALNRACSGDTVVVRLLGNSESSVGEAKAADGDDDDADDAADSEDALAVEQIEAGDEAPVVADKANLATAVHGVVVGVVERRWRPYVATLQADVAGGMRHLAVPVDAAVPKIRMHYADTAAIADRYFVVAVDSWEADSQYPQGHFVRALGRIGTLDAEIDTILVERQIAVSQAALGFSEASLREMPVNSAERPWAPSSRDLEGRRDLRDTLIFSIDPRGSQDIDDAVSMRRTRTGFELGVHIADVAQFVQAGSATDAAARARGTTVYLADRRFNMIPEVLSERVCSLRGGSDRLAVSVIWDMDHEYNVERTWFGRTVIRSACEMCYEQAQELLDGQRKVEGLDPKLEPQLATGVKELTTAMRVLRSRRRLGGALELASTEIKFAFDPQTHAVAAAAPKRSLEIHGVIEEAMVFANAAVARRIHESFPTAALLRRHRSPTADRFERLQRAVRARGLDVDCSSNLALAQSLQRIAGEAGDADMAFLVKAMATLAMQEADYFATGDCATEAFAHYGLALEYYTHFTSPIRRYADIVVHRQLLAALQEPSETPKPTELSQAWVGTTAMRLNERNRQSKLAQRESTELFQSRYIAQLSGDGQHVVADGVVAEVRTNGLIVFVPKFGIRGPVHLRDKTGHIRLPLSTLTGRPRDADTHIDGCSDFSADAGRLSIRLPIDAPAFHLGGGANVAFSVFDHVTVLLRVLETRRRRAPVYMTLVSRASSNIRAYRSTLAPLDRTFRVSAARPTADQDAEPAEPKGPSKTTGVQKPGPAKPSPDYYSVLEKFGQLSLLETTHAAQML
ncbi:hypothetical protein IW139_000438 [Coemansia sp. RSA 353]|nr:hypothetical protein GGH15_001128 [Coemansia sp. RSA 562]KAJ2191177.1 hypothetical protein EV181_000492 [Coemansia sp. RSA 532]KAJ2200155.1 hypothetical protein GGH18_000011 [Coemansia sp. RSA 530]KAJ2201788.1 hypothetical protein IW144_000131 [Coemansia sp. RSA 522]KAJ2208941.1 hypothetical protein IW145_000352 [Coemansia sp. RSA 521]KAJ2231388.1 hypothetical protein EV180_000383 [Coemansia sp. RSA 518]KAJ2292422.1 hypothetical protein IW141_001936 [Coemansia sp. RSA 355]KAJ2301362.1 hyp